MKTIVLCYEGGILWGTARVKLIPNWMERRLGYKLDIKEYKWEGDTYWAGGERKWYDGKTGKVFGRFPEIDNYIRMRKYNRENKEMVIETAQLYNAFRDIDETFKDYGELVKKMNETTKP